MDDVPKTRMPASEFEGEGKGVVNLITELKLVSSKSDGFRTIEQGGLTIDDVKVTDPKLMITKDMFRDGKILIRKGKKTYHMVELI